MAPALIGDADATLSLSYSSAGGGLRTCKHDIKMRVENAPAISSVHITLATLPHFAWQAIPSKTGGNTAESDMSQAPDFAMEKDGKESVGEKVEAVEGGREVCACAVLDVENESLQPFTLCEPDFLPFCLPLFTICDTPSSRPCTAKSPLRPALEPPS